jgi:sulfate transport system permease protein
MMARVLGLPRLPRLLRPSVIPGFGLTLGYGMIYLSLMVLLPLSALVAKAASLDWTSFWRTVSDARVVAAYELSIGASLIAAAANVVVGAWVAWVLVRYRFPGRRVVDALVDLPFALPTAVAGLALSALYAPDGWFGRLLPFKVAYTPFGVVLALAFVGLPFVVRTVQPVLEDLSSRDGAEVEEAAACLGAGRLTVIGRIILPELWPALVTGFALAFARGVGEYGSVIFIAGNRSGESQIAPLVVITKLEEYDYAGATAVAMVLLVFSFVALLAINRLQRLLATRSTDD